MTEAKQLGSPMDSPANHDTFALLHKGKDAPFPGMARVTVDMQASNDNMTVVDGGNTVEATNPPLSDIEVQLHLWTAEQWHDYEKILSFLHDTGGQIYTCAHPEVRSRRIKQLYFERESSKAYSPRDGYKTTLKFKEYRKPKPAADTTLAGQDYSFLVDKGEEGNRGPVTEMGRKVATEALLHLDGIPEVVGERGETTATPGWCSAFTRVAAMRAGMPRSLFGANAKRTEENFRKAGLSRPYTGAQNLRVGDILMFYNDPSGDGHIGIVVGFDRDGMPRLANNSFINKPDGRAINRLDELTTSKKPANKLRPPWWVSSARHAASCWASCACWGQFLIKAIIRV